MRTGFAIVSRGLKVLAAYAILSRVMLDIVYVLVWTCGIYAGNQGDLLFFKRTVALAAILMIASSVLLVPVLLYGTMLATSREYNFNMRNSTATLRSVGVRVIAVIFSSASVIYGASILCGFHNPGGGRVSRFLYGMDFADIVLAVRQYSWAALVLFCVIFLASLYGAAEQVLYKWMIVCSGFVWILCFVVMRFSGVLDSHFLMIGSVPIRVLDIGLFTTKYLASISVLIMMLTSGRYLLLVDERGADSGEERIPVRHT